MIKVSGSLRATRNFAYNKSGDFMKILVIFTGGTIGSAVTDGWISPASEMKYLLIEKYRERTGDDMEFDTITPYTILSENISAENINALIKCVGENINKYDGIIVTHGTDTLQFSAAALAYAFGCNCTPVVLVSSNYTITDERANGVDNFIGAVNFIKSQSGRGVFVSYKNNSENIKFHIATRILSHNECFDEIHSFDRQHYAEYDGEKVVLNPDCHYENTDSCISDSYYENESRVLVLTAVPGEKYQYNFHEYDAVIIKPFHSGSLNTNDNKFCRFCNSMRVSKVSVFVTGVHGGVTYESLKPYEKLGLNVLPLSSFPAIYMKLWLAVSRQSTPVDFMFDIIANEFCENK